MLKCIEYCFNNGIVASFLCDEGDTQSILVGYVQCYNDSEVLIAHISAHGYYDGFILKHIDDISRIGYNGDYERKIEKLYNLRKQVHLAFRKEETEKEEVLHSLLEIAKKYNYIASLYLRDSSISGFIDTYSDDMISLRVIDEFGKENGIMFVRIDEIVTIAVDSDDEQDLTLLRGQG